MSKDDENILSSLNTTCSIDEGLGNVGMVHVAITAEHAPQHALKCGDASAINRANNKPEKDAWDKMTIQHENYLLEVKLDS